MPPPGLWPLSWPEPFASLCSLVIKDDLCQILLVPRLGQDATDLEIKALSWIRSELIELSVLLCTVRLKQIDHFLCNAYWKVSWAPPPFFFVGLNKIKHMKVCGEEPRTYRASASCMTLPWILAAPQHCQIAVVIIHTTNKDGECWEWNGGD